MRHFQEQLKSLEADLLKMAATVELSISNCVTALIDRNEQQAQSVLDREAVVNQLEIQVDAAATRALALYQPMAGDLRLVTAAMKINTDLERMGDLATNVAERALSLIHRPPVRIPIHITRMASLAQAMVRDSVQAFVHRDARQARQILISDDAVDQSCDALLTEQIELMRTNPAMIAQGVDLVLVANDLERIADHATNIAESVIFVVQGVDIRHHSEAKV